jgi:hypothetical protein
MNIVSLGIHPSLIHGIKPCLVLENVNISIDNIKELILYFYNGLVRTNNAEMYMLLNKLLEFLFNKTNDMNSQYLICLYCLIGHTRDNLYGRNEYMLTYMLLYVWSQYNEPLSIFALKSCVNVYGNWKDIKGVCQYIKDNSNTFTSFTSGIFIKDSITSDRFTSDSFTSDSFTSNSLFIQNAIKLLNDEIYKDTQKEIISEAEISEAEISEATISEASKCAPRQTAKNHGWIFTLSAKYYFDEYIEKSESDENPNKKFTNKYAIKAKTEYRKIITELTKKYDEQQIKTVKTVKTPSSQYSQMYIPKCIEINNVDPTNIEDNWNLLMEIVNSPRYEILNTKMSQYFLH